MRAVPVRTPQGANRLVVPTRLSPTTGTSKAFAMIPVIAFSWILIFRPLLGSFDTTVLKVVQGGTVADWENRVFWSTLLAATLLLALLNRSRISLGRLGSLPIIALAAYLILSGASITWAYSTEHAFSRFSLEMMVLLTFVLPFSLMSSMTDTMQNLYRCYVFAIFINVVVVLNQNPLLTATGREFGYYGYFGFKGYLGECASIAFLMSLYELLFPGRRRYLAILVILGSIWLIFASKSKGSLAFALVAPVLAALTIAISRKLRMQGTIVLVLAVIPLSYVVASMITNDLIGKISYRLYGDSSLTGRTIIWDFVQNEISRRPWLGWGFHSFWLVGPNAPSVVEAPIWVGKMTGSHSGYLDVKVETGRIGLTLFIGFIVATLYAIERVMRQDPARAWFLLSLALYVIISNFIETVWLARNDPLWYLFVLVAAETTRYSYSTRQISLAVKRPSRVSVPRQSRPVRVGVARSGKSGL